MLNVVNHPCHEVHEGISLWSAKSAILNYLMQTQIQFMHRSFKIEDVFVLKDGVNE